MSIKKISLTPVFDANYFFAIQRKKTQERHAYEWAQSIKERHPIVRLMRDEAAGLVRIGDARVRKMLQDMLATDNELNRHFNAIYLAKNLAQRVELRRLILEDEEKNALQLRKIIDDYKKEIIIDSRGKIHQRQRELFDKIGDRAWEHRVTNMVIISNALDDDIAEYKGFIYRAKNNLNNDDFRWPADKPRVEISKERDRELRELGAAELKRVEASRQLLMDIKLAELNLKLAAHEMVAHYGILKNVAEYAPKPLGKNMFSPKIVTGILHYKKKDAA